MSLMITEAMSYLDDNWQRLPEEVYLEMGRKLADAQDAVPQLYRVVSFVVDDETSMKRHESVVVGVAPEDEDRAPGGGRLSVRELLERGMCRPAWLVRSFPQIPSASQKDCLLIEMVPYHPRAGGGGITPTVNIDHMFDVEPLRVYIVARKPLV